MHDEGNQVAHLLSVSRQLTGGDGEGTTGGDGKGGEGDGLLMGGGDGGGDVPVQAPKSAWQPVRQCASDEPQ